MRRFTKIFLSVFCTTFLGATALFKYLEKVSWTDAFQWATQTSTSTGYGQYALNSPASIWLSTVYQWVAIIGFALLTTILISALLELRDGRKFGQGRIRFWPWSSEQYLAITPTSWKQVRQLMAQLQVKTEAKIKLVVIADADRLEELPPDLMAAGVRFIRGNPNEQEPYLRAGVEHPKTKGAFILGDRYGDPWESDCDTGEIASRFGRKWQHVRRVAEVVLAKHRFLFPNVHRMVFVDQETVGRLSQLVTQDFRLASKEMTITPDVIGGTEEFRTALLSFLQAAGLGTDAGEDVNFFLPTKMDDPSCDALLRGAILARRADGRRSYVSHMDPSQDPVFAELMEGSACLGHNVIFSLVSAMLDE